MVPVTDAQLAGFNDQRRLRHDPVFTGLVRPALLGLAGHLDALADTDVTELEQLWISLLTMLMRSLAGRDTTGTDTAPARRLQVRRYIDAHLTDPRLSPTMIADALHVSRSTLYAALPADSGASPPKSAANASHVPTRSFATPPTCNRSPRSPSPSVSQRRSIQPGVPRTLRPQPTSTEGRSPGCVADALTHGQFSEQLHIASLTDVRS